MKTKTSSFLCKGLAALVATVLCASSFFAFPGGYARSAFAAGEDNSWQIVSGKYDPDHKTSEGLSTEELAEHSFAESADEQVRVTKTVEPTSVEDEFVMHLSIDTSATSVQVTDYETFFINAPYKATTSNGYHGYQEGSVTTDEKGTMDVQVGGSPDVGSRSGVFNILDPQGRLIAEGVTLYWSQANNITILLQIENKYIIMGTQVRFNSTNNLRLTEEAYELVKKAIAGAVQQGDPTTLKSVTDVMGDNVEYLGAPAPDGGTAAYDDQDRTLTWIPEYNGTYKKVDDDPVVIEERNEHGAVTKVTITQRSYFYGAASLTYKIRLNTQAQGFESSYDPAEITNAYDTNRRAVLDYSYSTDGGATTQTGNVDFPRPKVKGVLYDLRLHKTDEIATPLAGATFKLTRTWADSFGVEHVDLIADDLVSDSDGYVTVPSLSWGAYALEETAPPSGHTMPDDPAARTFNFGLCYTSDRDSLTASTISAASAHHAMLATQTPVATNERVKTDVSLLKIDSQTSAPIEGARFALYVDNGDGVFDESTDCIDANKVAEVETDANGVAVFQKLTVGTYYLKETRTPAGYELNGKVYRIDVYDVEGAAGGAEGNMIRVGDADGSNMQPPSTANTVTVADRPIPALPVAAGPGTIGIVWSGVALLAIGSACAAACKLRARHRAYSGCHLIK